jgi:hypothetical protein
LAKRIRAIPFLDTLGAEMTSIASQMTDFEFLTRKAEPRRHFLYAYTPGSALFRARVRQHVTAYAETASWNPMTVWPGDTLHGTLGCPSFLDDRFYFCDASQFSLDDLDDVMAGIANDAFESHLCLMISNRSKLLERASWFQACARVGVIAEPTVTIENYRSITRRLLEMNDLANVQGFGEDVVFLSRMKAFVQGQRGRSPFELAAEIDRLILTETADGVLRQVRVTHDDASEGGKLGDLVARFLDDRSTASFYPLLVFVGMALHSVNEPERLLVRFFRATAKIVAGSDRRYKRNREGNPAVLPYLVWGTMLLRSEYALCHGNFVVVFEQLCQAYNAAANEAAAWFTRPAIWQDTVRALAYGLGDRPAALDRAREKLRSALRGRVLGSSADELQWLVPVASEADQKGLT